ncbi:Uncharacterised protein [Yersinia kristensenii]|nr:Uncharacterised protein [Yersinia kristensenii]
MTALTGNINHTETKGKLSVAYSNEAGSLIGVEFTSVAQSDATIIMAVCAGVSDENPRMMSSSTTRTGEISLSGGDNMDRRVAVLENDVGRIKSDIAEIKTDYRALTTPVNETRRDVAIILQSLVDIKSSLDSKPSKSDVDAKISSSSNKQIIWTIGSILSIVGIAAAVVIKILSS